MSNHASKELVAQRLNELESYWLQGVSREQMIAHFQGNLPLPNCSTCRASANQAPPSCTHGSPRWEASPGKPVSVRTIEWYLTKVRRRASENFSLEERASHRALTLARLEKAYQHCAETNNIKDMIPVLRFMAQLNGSFVSVEESLEPTTYERVRSMMATCEDYTPSQMNEPPVDAKESRFLLDRLEHLLLQADDSLVDFRNQPKPKNDVEARLYLRNQTIHSIHQALTSPGLSPEARRDALIKLSASYGIISRDIDLAENLDTVKKMLEDYRNELSQSRHMN